jgi:hypothetical protein
MVSPSVNWHSISELERRHIVEQLDQLMAELEQSTEISQGAIDGVIEIYAIIGAKYEQQ